MAREKSGRVSGDNSATGRVRPTRNGGFGPREKSARSRRWRTNPVPEVSGAISAPRQPALSASSLPRKHAQEPTFPAEPWRRFEIRRQPEPTASDGSKVSSCGRGRRSGGDSAGGRRKGNQSAPPWSTFRRNPSRAGRIRRWP